MKRRNRRAYSAFRWGRVIECLATTLFFGGLGWILFSILRTL